MRKRKILKKITGIFLGALTAFTPVYAEDSAESTASASAIVEPETLESRISAVISEYGLDTSSLAVSYYVPSTGESYAYNDTTYMFAASTYKVPLNMWYYMQESAGNLSADSTVGGYTLSYAHYLSIVYSDNDASEALLYAIGSYRLYKEALFTTFGGEEYGSMDLVDSQVYQDNVFPAKYMMNVMKYLYENQDQFTELLSYMSSSEQTNDFTNNVSQSVTVYQKQGWYTNVNNVVEIVCSDTPYLAVIMVDDSSGNSRTICSAINDIIYEYNQEMTTYAAELAAEEARIAQLEAQASASAEALALQEAEKEAFWDNIIRIVQIGAGVFVLLVIVLFAVRHHNIQKNRKRRRRRKRR